MSRDEETEEKTCNRCRCDGGREGDIADEGGGVEGREEEAEEEAAEEKEDEEDCKRCGCDGGREAEAEGRENKEVSPPEGAVGERETDEAEEEEEEEEEEGGGGDDDEGEEEKEEALMGISGGGETNTGRG